jgi:hypothetical protein
LEQHTFFILGVKEEAKQVSLQEVALVASFYLRITGFLDFAHRPVF